MLLRPAVSLVDLLVGLLIITRAERDDFRGTAVLKWGLEIGTLSVSR
jgi:hypothetical protein